MFNIFVIKHFFSNPASRAIMAPVFIFQPFKKEHFSIAADHLYDLFCPSVCLRDHLFWHRIDPQRARNAPLSARGASPPCSRRQLYRSFFINPEPLHRTFSWLPVRVPIYLTGIPLPVWWNGRRDGFKIRWGDPCGFESHHRHHRRNLAIAGFLLFSIYCLNSLFRYSGSLYSQAD